MLRHIDVFLPDQFFAFDSVIYWFFSNFENLQVEESRRTHEGGVVRSNLHSHETRQNLRKSGYERTKSLINA